LENVVLIKHEERDENNTAAIKNEGTSEEKNAEEITPDNDIDASDEAAGYGYNIFQAAADGNLEAVRNFIENGEDVDAGDGFNWTPLVYAVQAEQEDVIEYLIATGADVNEYQYAVGPGWDVSIFELAMESGNQRIIDLITKAGVDDHIIDNYYDAKLNEYLSWGKTKEAEALILQGKASLPQHPSLLLLVHYNQGSAGIRQLIRTYGPAEITDGSANLLDRIIPGNISFDYGICADFQPFPMATTYKYDESDPFRFSPDKAFDNDRGTVWAEGVKGPGAGEKIAFYVNEGMTKIAIIAGFAGEDMFMKYNRVKQAVLRFYIEEENVGQIKSEFTYTSAGTRYKLSFKDEPGFQEFSFRLPEPAKDGPYTVNIIGVLEIVTVYPGSDYDDTCIAEIKL
jgi:hypothetical protein